jgi:integrase
MYKIFNGNGEFKVDNELKQEYLKQKPTATAESDSFVLKATDEYEKLLRKSIYNMTYVELKELILMQFKNSSEKTVLKNVSILKTYIDFCINKNVVLHGENRLATFSSNDANDFVNKQAFLGKYHSKEQIREFQDLLYNEQDKLFLELLFQGVRGRTTEDGTLEEIINLRISDVNEEKKRLRLVQNNGNFRYLEVDEYTIELIKDTYKQDVYVENNGEMTDNIRLSEPRKLKINKVEDYVLRVPSKNKYQIFTPNLINSRMRRIKIWLGENYLTATSIFESGMLNMALEIYKEKGEIQKDDYIKICQRYNYGIERNSENVNEENINEKNYESRYWFNVKALFEKYLEIHGIK